MALKPQILYLEGESTTLDNISSKMLQDVEAKLFTDYGITLAEAEGMLGKSKFGDWINKTFSDVTNYFDQGRDEEARALAMKEFMMLKQQQEKNIFSNPMVLGGIALGAILLLRK